MAVYRRGSTGPEVIRIQDRLRELGHYAGPSDGAYGGGTEAAVRRFQSTAGLPVDGVVGPAGWAALFPGTSIPMPAITLRSLVHRCTALTGAFETGAPPPDCFAGLGGDFDGQGISFGVLQWNHGQGTLQPLLLAIDRDRPDVVDDAFHEHAAALRTVLQRPRAEQLAWARSIQDPVRHRVFEPWRGMLKTLGRHDAFQVVQCDAARGRYESALDLCATFGLWSERAVALMFDIVVQNGSIGHIVRAEIERDFRAMSVERDGADGSPEHETARMRVVANRRAEAARPQWVQDVRERKLTIANGEGTVHGGHYDLAEDYGIRLVPFALSEGMQGPTLAAGPGAPRAAERPAVT
jgi:hypothetical protein